MVTNVTINKINILTSAWANVAKHTNIKGMSD